MSARTSLSGTFVGFAAFALAACGPAGPAKSPTTEDGILTIPGVDTHELVLEERRNFTAVIKQVTSPCGEAFSIATCILETRGCKRCLPAAAAAAQLVSHGYSVADASKYLGARFSNEAVKTLDLKGAPRLGPEDAPVKVVEFVDFECPHCAKAAPILRKILEGDDVKGKVALYYRGFPLPMHSHAEPAARAAMAAHAQGKFWPLADALFEHQDDLGDTALAHLAGQVSGLDVVKWKKDWMSAEVAAQIAFDKDQGSQLSINGTPTIFINGRRFQGIHAEDFARELHDWIRTDVDSL